MLLKQEATIRHQFPLNPFNQTFQMNDKANQRHVHNHPDK